MTQASADVRGKRTWPGQVGRVLTVIALAGAATLFASGVAYAAPNGSALTITSASDPNFPTVPPGSLGLPLTVTVQNTGTQPSAGTLTVSVTAELPLTISAIVDAQGPPSIWTCAVGPPATCSASPGLGAGATADITVSYDVPITAGRAEHLITSTLTSSDAGDTIVTPIAFAGIIVSGRVQPRIYGARLPSPVTVGGDMSYTVGISDALDPDGVIVIWAYGPDDPGCRGSPAFTSQVQVAGNGEYDSGPFSTSTVGTYHFVVYYGGDARNESAYIEMVFPPTAPDPPVWTRETCLGTVVVVPATPAITTQASAPVAAGGVITAATTLTAAVHPTGTVTFDVFGPDNDTCTGAPAFTSTKPVTDTGSSTSDPFTTSAPGSYHFLASYSGDPNNAAAGPTSCSDPAASVSVGPAPQIAVTSAAAGPSSRPAPGGDFSFTLTVENPSTVQPGQIMSLVDDIYGDLATRPGSTCAALIATTLAPGTTSPPCTFTGSFTGAAGASQTDTVTITAREAGGVTVTSTAQNTVTITAAAAPSPSPSPSSAPSSQTPSSPAPSPATSGVAGLAATGSAALPLTKTGLLLMFLGAALVAAGRRRARS